MKTHLGEIFDFLEASASPAVSHIPQFGDAVPPAGGLLASPTFGICDITSKR